MRPDVGRINDAETVFNQNLLIKGLGPQEIFVSLLFNFLVTMLGVFLVLEVTRLNLDALLKLDDIACLSKSYINKGNYWPS